MAVYAISDLHLALSMDKPMDIFGNRWVNYMQKLKKSWQEIVTDDDYVIVPGDISWATYLSEAKEDFEYIHMLPGKKIISKGNHDYWWATLSKLEKFVMENEFYSISFMQNNSFWLGKNIILCGTRGWKCPGDEDFSSEDRKIYNRELQRLELSLKSIRQNKKDDMDSEVKSDEEKEDNRIIVALHYPPFNAKGEASEFVDIMKNFGVHDCIYGHLHGEGFKNAVEGNISGIEFKLVSADYLDFKPFKIV